jgi:eukaryotic-like serine/threonine-protein kinase
MVTPITRKLARPTLKPGDILCDRYEILEELGRGAMGIVYRARHRKLGDLVAVKVVDALRCTGPEALGRFRREAKLANRIKHPNVIRVLDLDETPWGAPFLVEELVEGMDLQVHLDAKDCFSPREVIDILVPLCEALSAAHEEGIIHRDLKPGNVMISRRRAGVMGQSTPRTAGVSVKLIDFGLAKALDDTKASFRTIQGVVGTPAYMAPEQIRGEELDARVDVYALGVLLYELLTGAVPFPGDGALEIAEKVLGEAAEEPSLRAPGREIPEKLARLAMQALSKERGARPKSAEEFCQKLLAAREELSGRSQGWFSRLLSALGAYE